MWFTNDSVDAILRAFMVLIRRLDAIAKARQQESIAKLRESDKLLEERDKIQAEGDRAMRVANKLRELVE